MLMNSQLQEVLSTKLLYIRFNAVKSTQEYLTHKTCAIIVYAAS